MEMKPKRLGGKGTTGSGCNNVNMLHFTTEVTIVLTSRPKYTTTRDLGREGDTNSRAVLVRRKLYRIV